MLTPRLRHRAVLGGEAIHRRVGTEPGERASGRRRPFRSRGCLARRRPQWPARRRGSRPHLSPVIRDLEFGLRAARPAPGRQTGEARDQPVSRQDQRPGVAHADQHHQAEVRWIVVRRTARRLGSSSSRIFQAGLVAVVAVGDEDGPGGHQAADRGVSLRVVDDPEPVLDAEVVGRHQRRTIADSRLERCGAPRPPDRDKVRRSG